MMRAHAAALLVLTACRDSAAPPDAAPAPSSAPSLPPKLVNWTPPRAPPARTCKVLGVSGKITPTPTPTPITSGIEAPLRTWLDLDDKAKLSTKEPRTGRELSFEGPARVQPCRAAGDEEAWVLRGGLASAPGTGEAPGQEEWIVTPLLVVRYAAATLKVAVDATVEARVAGGTASVWLAEGAILASDAGGPDAEGWLRLEKGMSVSVRGKKFSPEESARAAVAQCTLAANRAHDVARAIMGREAGAAPFDLGAAHVMARKEARATCAVASLRTAALTSADARSALDPQVEAADKTWRAIREGEKP